MFVDIFANLFTFKIWYFLSTYICNRLREGIETYKMLLSCYNNTLYRSLWVFFIDMKSDKIF